MSSMVEEVFRVGALPAQLREWDSDYGTILHIYASSDTTELKHDLITSALGPSVKSTLPPMKETWSPISFVMFVLFFLNGL